MRRLLVSLNTDEKGIEYSIDMDLGKFESSIIDSAGQKSSVQVGAIGKTDAEKQDLALRLYHICLAALRTSPP